MDAGVFDSPLVYRTQRRPAKITIQTEECALRRRTESGCDSPPSMKVHLSYIPPGYRTPPYTSGSSSGGSSPTSCSNEQRFNFDPRHVAAKLNTPTRLYDRSGGATVQLLSLKSGCKAAPPKQMLPLCQAKYSSDSSRSSSYAPSYASRCDHGHRQKEPFKQSLSLREWVGSELAQDVCAFCYQFAVHYAHARSATPLPRVADRGYWRGHVMMEAGRIVCPRLLRRVCSLCGATGQSAHLNNFCPIAKQHISSY